MDADENLIENNVNESESKSPTKENKSRKRSSSPIRKFPCHTIEEAKQIAENIKEHNAGNPWNTEQVAKSVNMAKGGNPFYYLTAASRDYGFTQGSRDTENIELTDFGTKFVYAPSVEQMDTCKKEAFFKIELFKQVFDYYKNQGPEDTFFKNVLKTNFNVDDKFQDDFIRIYRENVRYINLSSEIKKNEKDTIKTEIAGKESHKSNQNRLFVIMPFSEKTGNYEKGFFNEVFTNLIVPSAQEVSLFAYTANQNGSDIIHATIGREIKNADIILADLTEHNPNVLFELGLAIMLKKKIALIRAKGTGAIFDVDNVMRVLDYDSRLWKSTIETDVINLIKHLKAAQEVDSNSYYNLFINRE